MMLTSAAPPLLIGWRWPQSYHQLLESQADSRRGNALTKWTVGREGTKHFWASTAVEYNRPEVWASQNGYGMKRPWRDGVLILAGLLPALLATASHAPAQAPPPGLDGRVAAFLQSHRHSWNALNVPYEDGKILHDLVLAGRFRNILEIGTSTGHSTIWLAWAAAKTGGKVLTIEIDPGRRAAALENFRQAGVEAYIDARLADAHDLVKRLPGPFDFVFSDADKEWYLNYFKDLDAKVAVGGCFAAHNALRVYAREVQDFLDYVRAKPNYRTRIERGSGEGISVSCKTAP